VDRYHAGGLQLTVQLPLKRLAGLGDGGALPFVLAGLLRLAALACVAAHRAQVAPAALQ
jgi:hypothetical protein